MSMTAITVFQLIEIFIVYGILTILVPHLVLGKTLQLKNRYEKLMMYTMAGNFYVINLVYLLELCHICYPVTLIILTVVPCFFIKIKLEHIDIPKLVREKAETIRRLTGGQMTLKSWNEGRKPVRRQHWIDFAEHIKQVYVRNILDVVLILILIALLCYVYGINIIEQYGYKASDIIVHNYWINAMSDNDIFVTGVYPYGFHCMLFYIKSVFGIDTYILLRLMSFVAVIWDFLMILCFLKLFCKSRYAAYVGLYIYAAANFISYSTYSRYAATLPQEYGFMFIMPAIYSGFMFFYEQRKVDRGSVSKKNYFYLVSFGVSFALTLTVHFYGTMVVGFYAVAMVIGYCVYFFRKQYFSKIMATVFISLFVAILPMGIAVASGTELQGSLMWGLSIITGEDTTEQTDAEDEEDEAAATDSTDDNTTASVGWVEGMRNPSYYTYFYGKILGPVLYMKDLFRQMLSFYIFCGDYQMPLCEMGVMLIPILIISGIICICMRNRNTMYGMALISSGIYMIIIILILSAFVFKYIPSLMDTNRASIYLALSLSFLISFALDGILYIFLGKKGNSLPLNIASLILVLALCFVTFKYDLIRERIDFEGQEMNDSIICLTNIMKDEKRNHWTIVSANDENRMADDSGYHYELIDFLWGMEYVGATGRVRIPTDSVYVFIEKRPLNYYISWEGSGSYISEEGCKHKLHSDGSIGCYQGVYRYVVMSRAYCWAKRFQELYPNEVSVYYESDDFVCYKIEQNPYRLFNFAIDYGYNMQDYIDEDEVDVSQITAWN